MEITNDAKVMLQNFFKTNDTDCIKGTIGKSCCGTSLAFGLAKLSTTDEPIEVNEIKVLLDDEGKNKAQSIIIEVSNGNLVIRDKNSSGCC